MPNIARTTKGSADKPLTDRQRRFVEEYMVDLNATAAAVRAGYSAKTSGLYTSLMGLPHVKAAVERALAWKRSHCEIDSKRVLEQLGRIAFANIFDFVSVDAAGRARIDVAAARREHGSAVAGLSIDYHPVKAGSGEEAQVRRVALRLADRTAALREIARHLGLFHQLGDEEDEPAEAFEFRDIHVITGVPSKKDPTGDLGFMWRVPVKDLGPEGRRKGVGVHKGDPPTLLPHEKTCPACRETLIAATQARRLEQNQASRQPGGIPAPGAVGTSAD